MGHATLTEKKNVTPYGPKSSVKYADPGYQSDGVARYPIDTKAHTKSAWAYINQADNQKPYTAQQVASIKGRIKAAAKKFGIDITSDKETVTSKAVLTEDIQVGGVTEWMGMNSCCGFSISAFNGPLTVSVSAYDGIAPGDLPVIAKAAMDAAIQAVQALDPDEDGDVDVPGSSNDAGEGDTKNPSDTADDLAGDVVSPDDDMETRTYSVTATTTEGSPLTVTVQGHMPNPRAVADAIARRKAKTSETTSGAETPAPSPPAVPADVPPANPSDADPAPDSPEQENAMSDKNTAPEETTAPPAPAISEDALKAFADALGPVIGTAVEGAVTKALAAREPAKPADPAPAAAETAPAAAPGGQDVTALAEAVKASLDGLPSALAEAIKPLITTAPAAETTQTAPVAVETVTPAAEPANPKDVALEAAKLAIPELLEAFGLPRRKGLVAAGEHRGDKSSPQTPEELWAARGQVWDQLIPAAPAAVQPGGTVKLADAVSAA